MRSPAESAFRERPAFGLGWRQLVLLLALIGVGFAAIALLPEDASGTRPRVVETER